MTAPFPRRSLRRRPVRLPCLRPVCVLRLCPVRLRSVGGASGARWRASRLSRRGCCLPSEQVAQNPCNYFVGVSVHILSEASSLSSSFVPLVRRVLPRMFLVATTASASPALHRALVPPPLPHGYVPDTPNLLTAPLCDHTYTLRAEVACGPNYCLFRRRWRLWAHRRAPTAALCH